MTKAERIFEDTYRACRSHINTWGVEYNADGTVAGFMRLHLHDDEFSCTRTVNAVQKILNSKQKSLNMNKTLGLEVDNIRELALLMVQSTINNERKAIAD